MSKNSPAVQLPQAQIDAYWANLPRPIRDAISAKGLPKNIAVTLLHEAISIQQIENYQGPVPHPDIMRKFKDLGVLDAIMVEFQETSKAQNRERNAKAEAVLLHAQSEAKLTRSRCFNETLVNVFHGVMCLAVLVGAFFFVYKGVAFIQSGDSSSGWVAVTLGLVSVLGCIIKSFNHRL